MRFAGMIVAFQVMVTDQGETVTVDYGMQGDKAVVEDIIDSMASDFVLLKLYEEALRQLKEGTDAG